MRAASRFPIAADPSTTWPGPSRRALGSPNYFDHDAGCGGNIHSAARSFYCFGHEALIPDAARRDQGQDGPVLSQAGVGATGVRSPRTRRSATIAIARYPNTATFGAIKASAITAA